MIAQAGAATAVKYPKAEEIAVDMLRETTSPPRFKTTGATTATVAELDKWLENIVVNKIEMEARKIVKSVI